MKRFVVLSIAACAILAMLFIVILPTVNRPGKWSSCAGDELLKFIRHNGSAADGNDAAEQTLTLSDRKSMIPASGVIKLDAGTFAAGYDDIYDHRAQYSGRGISVAGYVETDHLPTGQFLVGRDLVWCCQSDKYFIGFLVLTDGPIPRADSELRVSGTIESARYTDPDTGKTFDVPAIRMSKMEPAPKFSRDVFPSR